MRGPTLIAFYPNAPQAQVDSSEELSTVLDDFSFHLSTARDSLAAQGFTTVERPGRLFTVVEGTQARTIAAALDSADVGYVFVAPGRRDRFYYGVMTNSDLIEMAHRFLSETPVR